MLDKHIRNHNSIYESHILVVQATKIAAKSNVLASEMHFMSAVMLMFVTE